MAATAHTHPARASLVAETDDCGDWHGSDEAGRDDAEENQSGCSLVVGQRVLSIRRRLGATKQSITEEPSPYAPTTAMNKGPGHPPETVDAGDVLDPVGCGTSKEREAGGDDVQAERDSRSHDDASDEPEPASRVGGQAKLADARLVSRESTDSDLR